MRVQYCARAAIFHDANVQQAFVGRFCCVIADKARVLVDGEHLLGGEFAFVDAARAHREPEWFAFHDRAQVAAGAEQPTTSMKTARGGGEIICELGKVVWHAAKDATKRTFLASVGC